VDINYHLYNEQITIAIFTVHTDHKDDDHKRSALCRETMHHAQIIIAISPQISHVGFEYFLKQKSMGVSNSSSLCSK